MCTHCDNRLRKVNDSDTRSRLRGPCSVAHFLLHLGRVNINSPASVPTSLEAGINTCHCTRIPSQEIQKIWRKYSANANYHHFIADGTVNLGYKVWPRRNSFLTNKSEIEAKKMRSTRGSAKQHAQNHEGVPHALGKLCLFLFHIILGFNP